MPNFLNNVISSRPDPGPQSGYRVGEPPDWMYQVPSFSNQLVDVLTPAVDMAPGLGDLLALQEAVTGKSRTNQLLSVLVPDAKPRPPEDLAWWQRGLAGAAALPFVPNVSGMARKLGGNALTDVIGKYGGKIDDLAIRPKFGENLSPESTKLVNWYKANTRFGLKSVHYNSKTGLSIDFSTSCPKRLDPSKGPCPYCYVEHGRVSKKQLGITGGEKGIFEQPYQGEIMDLPDDLIRELNSDGGIRMFSFGDYRPVEDFDNVNKLLSDARERGLTVKAITKQPEFIETWGNHPNLRANISVDKVPREISMNAPSIDEAKALQAGRENIKIRSVALNEAEALEFAENPDVNVVTLYHGLTNFTNDKYDVIGIGRPAYEDFYKEYEKLGLDGLQKKHPGLKIDLSKKDLTQTEIDRGYAVHLNMRKPLPIDKKKGKYRHNKLFNIVKEQNPEMVKRVGEKRLLEYLDTWENMKGTNFFKEMEKKYPGKICCQGGKCSKDPTKCGFGYGALLLAGVLLPQADDEGEE